MSASSSSSYIIAKDCEVEVSSEDEGFIDAWYGAILLENPTKSGRKKLQVRYTTLVNEDGSTLLTELVEQRFIRPIPPNDMMNDVDFEEGSFVDADLKDGWWTGVVIKKLEDQNFLVYFNSPPDLIQFERKQLRTHLDWIDSTWVRSENKKLSNSLFSCGTMVEVSCKIDKVEAVWVPALIVKEIEVYGEKKFIVKCCDKSLSICIGDGDEVKPNITVDSCNVRPIPPPFFVEEYKLLDRVEVFRGSGWCQGLIRGLLAEKCYTVSFVNAKEESTFRHSDIRPSKVWEDGVWLDEPTRKLGEDPPSDGKRKMSVDFDTRLNELSASYRPKKLKIIRSCTAANKPIAPPGLLSTGGNAATTYKRTKKHTKKAPSSAENIETSSECETEAAQESQESRNQMVDEVILMDSVLNGLSLTSPVVSTPSSMIASKSKESLPPLTPVMNATPVKETEPETRGKTSPEKTLQPKENQNGFGVDSTGEKTPEEQKHDSSVEETTGEVCNGSEALITNTNNNICDNGYDQLLSAWLVESTCSDKSKLSPDRTTPIAAAVETRANEDTTMVLPFVKRSPVWKVFESMDVFKAVKQSPHFMPLLETREEFREGSAVGEMVKFSNLIERVQNLQLHTPKSTLEGLKECFSDLEKHGFDVAAPISRINKLIHLRDKQVKRLEELKVNEKEMAEEVIKKEKIEEDLREVESKLLELRNQESVLDKEIAEMQLRAKDLDQKIQDVEVEFQMTVEAPW